MRLSPLGVIPRAEPRALAVMLPAPLERAGVRVAVELLVPKTGAALVCVFAVVVVVVGVGVVVLISTGLLEF
jgi:hypothetical protein